MKLTTVNLYPIINPKHLIFSATVQHSDTHINIQPPQVTRNASERIEFGYDVHERLTKVQNKSHTVDLEYDIMSQIEKVAQDNILVHKKEILHTHNHILIYLNHSLKYNKYVQERRQTLTLDNQKPISLSYNIEEKTQTILYPNGHKEHYTFNLHKQLIKLETANQTFTYERDAMGRIAKLNDTHYKYGAIGRLTKAGDTKFKYDKAGNNKYHQAQYHGITYQILENHTYTYHYDKRGNLKYKVNKKTKEEKHYGFNVFNQLEEFLVLDSHGNQVKKLTYTYDGFNRRISKNEDDVLHYYLYNKENIIAILDEDKNELATIIHHPTRTDTPLSITTNNGTFYYHRDHQGSIIGLSNQEGKVVEFMEYDGHYGTLTNHTKLEDTLNPYGYTGRETDALDLYYYRARYYDPSIGQFISSDPIKFESGDFNFYRYVSNDPINFTDPSGLSPYADKIAGIGQGGTSTFLKDFTKNSGDLISGLASLPSSAWAYYTHLLNATGYTDLVKGHDMPICQCQAKLTKDAMLYGLENHYDDIGSALWEDMKSRPNYYIGGILLAPASKPFSVIAEGVIKSTIPIKVTGGAVDLMSSEINNFTGCY